jgi:hypothetical protein
MQHVTDLILRESKQLLPQPIPILHTPFLGQEIHNLICAFQEGIPVPPDRIRGVAILHFMRIPDLVSFSLPHFQISSYKQTYFVFHRSCAAFTLIFAVSRVKGGKGGLPASWVVDAILMCLYRGVYRDVRGLALDTEEIVKGRVLLSAAADMNHTPCC